MKQTIVFIVLISILACNNMSQSISTENASVSLQKSWNVLRTEGTFIIFDDNSHINTQLYEVSYIESLTDSKGIPYFVLSGRTCKECDENIAIFLFSLGDTVSPLSDLHKYTYPGKEYDFENNKLSFESKLFIGNCITSDDKSVCLIWLQKFINNSNSLDSSMFIVDIFNDKIRERNIKSQTQEYKSNLHHLKNCREIKGIETTSEP